MLSASFVIVVPRLLLFLLPLFKNTDTQFAACSSVFGPAVAELV